jgi:hypothetical protein
MHNDPNLKLRMINTGGEACPQVVLTKKILLQHYRKD